MFNFQLEPLKTEKITQGSLFIELPVYNDLLGVEYDLIEEMEVTEMLWNSKLLELTEKLATSRNEQLADIFQLLNEAESAGHEKRIELLGSFFPEFVAIINSKPKSRDGVLKLVTQICRRANPEITEEEVRKLPRNFTQKIHDFCLREQLGDAAVPYNDLLGQKQTLEINYSKSRAVIDSIYNSTNKPGAVKSLIEEYYKSFDSLGK